MTAEDKLEQVRLLAEEWIDTCEPEARYAGQTILEILDPENERLDRWTGPTEGEIRADYAHSQRMRRAELAHDKLLDDIETDWTIHPDGPASHRGPQP